MEGGNNSGKEVLVWVRNWLTEFIGSFYKKVLDRWNDWIAGYYDRGKG